MCPHLGRRAASGQALRVDRGPVGPAEVVDPGPERRLVGLSPEGPEVLPRTAERIAENGSLTDRQRKGPEQFPQWAGGNLGVEDDDTPPGTQLSPHASENRSVPREHGVRETEQGRIDRFRKEDALSIPSIRRTFSQPFCAPVRRAIASISGEKSTP